MARIHQDGQAPGGEGLGPQARRESNEREAHKRGSREGVAHRATGLDQLAQRFREDPEALARALADLLERGDREVLGDGSRARPEP